MGEELAEVSMVRSIESSGTNKSFLAVFMLTYLSEAGIQAALEEAEPVLTDVPNYTDAKPQIIIGANMNVV